jgi:hypothetical protein
MSTNNTNIQHPFDQLEAFALDALEPVEEEVVASHLEQCETCSAIVDDALKVLVLMSESLPEAAPPVGLRARVLDSIEPAAPPIQRVSVSPPPPSRSWSRVSLVSRGRLIWFLTPATAVLAVVAIAVAMTLNVQLSDQVGDMQSENIQLRRHLDESMATTAALARSSSAMSQVQGDLQRWQETSYVLAQPGNQTIVLTSARPGVDSKGVMVLSEDGREAVLMASDLAPLRPDSVYHVWLTSGGQWYWVGQLDVDNRGWGTMPMSFPDSLLQYDTVQISMGLGVAAAKAAPMGSTERAQATASMVGDMVLVANLR